MATITLDHAARRASYLECVATVAAYYRPRRMRSEFRARVISAYERGDLRELEYLRQVRGI
jgi:hypothetical protein